MPFDESAALPGGPATASGLAGSCFCSMLNAANLPHARHEVPAMLSTTMLLGLLLNPAWAADPASASPYARWTRGPSSDPAYFPIAVWLQDPRHAERYKQAGINLYVALWRGPTDTQLEALKAAGMPVICAPNAAGLAHRDDPMIVGWMHGDEPDNAQPVFDRATKKRSYGPPVPPPRIVADYERIRASDPSRPVMLNLGQGVANDEWVGRGPGAKLDDYKTYVQGGDIVSFDVYPIGDLKKPDNPNYLWYVAKGVDRLVNWTHGERIVWNCIECTHIHNAKAKATPHQVRAEVWMALVHGSRGLIYFVHEFQPKSNDHALLDDPEMLQAVTEINRQIHALGAILNTPSVPESVTVKSSSSEVPIDVMVKRHAGTTYVFAVAMRNAPARGQFEVRGLAGAAAGEVLGENRRVDVRNGRFTDDFAAYDVHLYAIRPAK